MSKTVIIGGVAGGATCATRLRRLDESREIVLLERGEYISYANCGLPYHVGDVIRSRQSLLVTTPEAMRMKYAVDVRTRHEAVAIDRQKKCVMVKDLESGEFKEESYDELVIATGSSPVWPPVPGIDDPRIRTLWTVPDADRLREMAGSVKSAVVIGGGFIGLEIAANLRHVGLGVSLVEGLDQVMNPLDFEMAQLLHEEIAASGVELHPSDTVTEFSGDDEGVTVKLQSGGELRTEMGVLSAGVKPNSQLAGDCGLELNERGGIVVDDHMRTADPSIYAVGDVIEVEDCILGGRTMIGLAGPANKQGRIAADNIAGFDEAYHGSQGTSVVKVFGLTAAFTGANEKTLIGRDMQKGRDYETVTITQNHHAAYYPGAQPMVMKLIFAADGSRIFGAQIIGKEGVDKRIDVIAVAQRLGAEPAQLKELELGYGPSYSSAKDPVNMLGFSAENVLRGLIRFADWDVFEKNPSAVKLDVQEAAERMAYELPSAVSIPLSELRERLGELDRETPYVLFCSIGVRAYNAARVLMENGFGNVSIYPGGTRFYRSVHPEEWSPSVPEVKKAAVESIVKSEEEINMAEMRKITIDCCGMQCPGPIMEVYKNINEMADGEVLEVSASDPGFARDIESWCRRTGNTLLSNEQRDGAYVAALRKGMSESGDESAAPAVVKETPQGKTIIVFDGDMDKVLASFIIANGALAMGRPVTMFFTFWGLNALRKSQKQDIKKTPVESMFGAMLPRGAGKLSLSKMNMGGMGTAMMKKIMKDKNIDSLEELMKKAMENGVKIIACSMSMDVMGIRKEELIDGVEIGGVGTYLGEAEEANVNLFI